MEAPGNPGRFKRRSAVSPVDTVARWGHHDHMANGEHDGPSGDIDPDETFALGNSMIAEGDTEGAEACWRQAGEAGHSKSMFNLGLLLGERGVLDEAAVWFRKAADGGVPNAMFELGLMSEDKGDVESAQDWFLQAARDGNADAMFELGRLQEDSDDREAAVRWYRQAEVPPANRTLGYAACC